MVTGSQMRTKNQVELWIMLISLEAHMGEFERWLSISEKTFFWCRGVLSAGRRPTTSRQEIWSPGLQKRQAFHGSLQDQKKLSLRNCIAFLSFPRNMQESDAGSGLNHLSKRTATQLMFGTSNSIKNSSLFFMQYFDPYVVSEPRTICQALHTLFPEKFSFFSKRGLTSLLWTSQLFWFFRCNTEHLAKGGVKMEVMLAPGTLTGFACAPCGMSSWASACEAFVCLIL